MKLYEIPFEVRNALDRIEVDEETGEILNAGDINAVELEAREKIENTALWLREQDAIVSALKDEIKRMKARLDSFTKRNEHIKQLTLSALSSVDGKVKTERVTVSIRHTKAVQVDEGADLPEAFLTVKTTVAPNKTAIKEALQGGAELPGCRIVENESLSIR